MEKAIAVIDYWSIKDTKGHCVQNTPDGKNCYLPHDMQGKKIELIMKDAGKCLIYDTLDICVHFLIQNGSSISIYYQYNNFRGTLLFVRADEGRMDKNDESILIDMLIKANEYERNHKQDDENKKEEPQNKQHNGEDNGFFEEYAEDLRVFAKAIDREMRFLRNNGGRKYKVTNGQFVMQSQGGYIYSFDLDAELYLAEDSPVTVTIGLDAISGTVLVCENFQIMIALERIPRSDTSLKIPKADISAEPWKLLQKLNECLRRVRQTNTIAMMLVKEGPTLAVPGLLSDIAKGQEKAYSHALTSLITVIWGPPGTGKTYTMAKISMEFLRQGKKVLIVSHSNVSVDNVAKQIFNQIQQDSLSFLLQKSKILRYGYVRDEELQENDLIASFKAAMRDSKEKSEYDCLQKKYKKLTEDAETSSDPKIQKEILLINQRLKVIAAKFKEVEKSLVADALLIATTVSKIYADSLFDYKTYDVVMFDEISMAYVPQIVAAASFAKEHLICVGDFRQLSPIVQEKNAKVVLGKDLFEFLNISKGFRDINPHPWLVMLDEQRRMHPAISAFPVKYIYSGLLKNHESVISNRNAIGKAAPFNQPMALIDLYGTCCFGSKNEDNSRFNILSAVFAFATALKSEKGQKQFADIRNEDKVGIITPYAAQTRLIKAMIQDYRHSNRNTSISCATVHQFQGSERNTIIFDAVESCPSTRAGWLMAKMRVDQ